MEKKKSFIGGSENRISDFQLKICGGNPSIENQ